MVMKAFMTRADFFVSGSLIMRGMAARHHLPGQAELVLQPAAGAFLAAGGQPLQ